MIPSSRELHVLCPSSLSLLVILMMPNHTMFVMAISENYNEHLADMICREASVRVCVDGEGDSMTLRWREFYRALCRHVRF